MSNFKSLVSGVGNLSKTTKYYDDWSENYDATLKLWNYQAPKKSIKFLKETTNFKPNNILDLACGTGLFGAELKKVYPKSHIYGSDISKKSLKISSEKKMSILLASHNMDEVKRLCKSILMMKEGKIIDRGTPSEIINKHGKKNLEEVFLKLNRTKNEL